MENGAQISLRDNKERRNDIVLDRKLRWRKAHLDRIHSPTVSIEDQPRLYEVMIGLGVGSSVRSYRFREMITKKEKGWNG